MTTSEPLLTGGGPNHGHDSTSFARDSPASPSVRSVKGVRRTILGGSGQPSVMSLAVYDLATSSWRTSSDCLLPDLELSSVIWPHSGSMRNGRCYPRAP